MLNYILGGAIIGSAVLIIFRTVRRAARGESCCGGCSGQCSSCNLSDLAEKR